MRVSWEVDREKQRLHTKHVGRVTIVEIAELIADSARDGTLTFQFLADAEGADFDLIPTDTQHFLEMLAKVANGTNLGAVAVITSGEAAAGAIHLLAQLAMGICEVAAFTEKEAAERWLGWKS